MHYTVSLMCPIHVLLPGCKDLRDRVSREKNRNGTRQYRGNDTITRVSVLGAFSLVSFHPFPIFFFASVGNLESGKSGS